MWNGWEMEDAYAAWVLAMSIVVDKPMRVHVSKLRFEVLAVCIYIQAIALLAGFLGHG